MAASSTSSWWQYAKWLNNIGRNMRITEPTGAELTAVKTFINAIWDNDALSGSRPWLATTYDKKSVRLSDGPRGDVDVEPTHVLVEILVAIARDMNDNVSITDAEATLIDTLIAATDNRRYGTGETFGGTSGSLVTIP
jgi:hypothetical protein